MCDPLTILGGVLGLGASLMGPSPAKPPPLPATDADAARSAGATVRVGDGQNDETTENDATPYVGRQAETRVFGRPVGGLGRSGLSL